MFQYVKFYIDSEIVGNFMDYHEHFLDENRVPNEFRPTAFIEPTVVSFSFFSK